MHALCSFCLDTHRRALEMPWVSLSVGLQRTPKQTNSPHTSSQEMVVASAVFTDALLICLLYKPCMKGTRKNHPDILGTRDVCTAKRGFIEVFLLPLQFKIVALLFKCNTGELIPQGESVPSWVLSQSTELERILLDPLVKTLAALH